MGYQLKEPLRRGRNPITFNLVFEFIRLPSPLGTQPLRAGGQVSKSTKSISSIIAGFLLTASVYCCVSLPLRCLQAPVLLLSPAPRCWMLLYLSYQPATHPASQSDARRLGAICIIWMGEPTGPTPSLLSLPFCSQWSDLHQNIRKYTCTVPCGLFEQTSTHSSDVRICVCLS